MRNGVLLLVVAALGAALVGCGSSDTSNPGPAPAFGSKAGPLGTAAGTGPAQPTVKGDSSEAK